MATSNLRVLRRAVRHGPDRVLHRLRNQRAVERVRGVAPKRILVMCLGNICRSPYAEGVLKRDLPGRSVRSAGFLESGRPAPREAVSVGAAHGVNLSAHRSTQVTLEALDWADIVIVMDARQATRIASMTSNRAHVERLGDFDPGPIDTRTVIDPIDRNREFFESVYTRIDECCRVFATAARAGEHA